MNDNEAIGCGLGDHNGVTEGDKHMQCIYQQDRLFVCKDLHGTKRSYEKICCLINSPTY